MLKKAEFRKQSATIGVISKQAGVKIETIRYYESIGMLPAPPRSDGGYRIYDLDQLKRLKFIRRCRELGFTLEKIKSLLRLVDSHHYTCNDIKDITSEQLDEVRHKISDLKKLEKILKDMTDKCKRGKVPECPIIDALYE